MPTLVSLSPWAFVIVTLSVMLFVLGLVALVAKLLPGGEVIVRLLPPKIEIRAAADTAKRGDTDEDLPAVGRAKSLVADASLASSNPSDAGDAAL